MLTQVTRSDGPTEVYTYSEPSHKHIDYPPRIVRKEIPGYGFLAIDYYHRSNNEVWPGKTEFVKNVRRGRVMRLNAPAGTDRQAVPIAHFLYNLDTNIEDDGSLTISGNTHVYDAQHHLKVYHFNREERLRKLESFTGTANHNPYCEERFYWNPGDGVDSGNLKSKVFSTAAEGIQFCCTYGYDEQGNMNEETLWGNLTGTNTSPLVVDEQGKPKQNGCEFLYVGHEHTQDGLNLIRYENSPAASHDFHYEYVPGTDLLAARYTISNI